MENFGGYAATAAISLLIAWYTYRCLRKTVKSSGCGCNGGCDGCCGGCRGAAEQKPR